MRAVTIGGAVTILRIKLPSEWRLTRIVIGSAVDRPLIAIIAILKACIWVSLIVSVLVIGIVVFTPVPFIAVKVAIIVITSPFSIA